MQPLVRAHAGLVRLLERRAPMPAVLDALDLAGVGEARVVVGQALRAGCHDGCECGMFRVAPRASNRMLTGPCLLRQLIYLMAGARLCCSAVLRPSQARRGDCYGSARCPPAEQRCSAKGTRIHSRDRSPQSMRHSLLADASSHLNAGPLRRLS